MMNRSFSLGWFSIPLAAALLPHAVRADDDDFPVSHQALVRLIPAADVNAFIARHADHIDSLNPIVGSIPSRNFHLFRLRSDADQVAFVNELRLGLDPDVAIDAHGFGWAEENYEADASEGSGRNFFLNVTPNADAYRNQAAWLQIGAPAAQQHGHGAGILVAVLDTGVDAAHPDLAGRIAPGGWNFACESQDQSACAGNGDALVNDVGDGLDSNADGSADEMVGHGTHIAGIIAHLAPDAMLLPVRVLNSDGDANNFNVARGIYYAIDQGVDVINASFGSKYKSDVVEEAVHEAQFAGIAVIASVGNMNSGDSNNYEYPAMMSDVLGIAGVNASNYKAPFSNWGEDPEKVSLCAPGAEIYSTIPGGLYASWDGTSMSAAIVSGAAALVLGKHSIWPNDVRRVEMLRAALIQTSVNVDAVNAGQPWEGLLGYGRLNIEAAAKLDCVEGFGPCPGDTNCNGTVNSFDIVPFITALSDPATYASLYPDCSLRSADCNFDGTTNQFDIQPFIDALIGG